MRCRSLVTASSLRHGRSVKRLGDRSKAESRLAYSHSVQRAYVCLSVRPAVRYAYIKISDYLYSILSICSIGTETETDTDGQRQREREIDRQRDRDRDTWRDRLHKMCYKTTRSKPVSVIGKQSQLAGRTVISAGVFSW